MRPTPIYEIDWHALYLQKTSGKPVFGKTYLRKLVLLEKPFISVVNKYLRRGARILDAGSGLGRVSLLLSLEGYKLTALDCSWKMLSIARKNVKRNGGKARFILGDLTKLPFKQGAFDAIVHQGILEHFSSRKAKSIIKHHLNIAPLVIFSVPLRSSRTDDYFSGDGARRNLMRISEWRKLLMGFKVLEMKGAPQRTLNMIAVISR
ncbi:MAG: class I SAM-dependent methyltransferase [Candidatus Micrarchaeota archaeon]